jgi:hypothetical protein
MQILSTTGGTLNFIPRENISSGKTYTLTIKSENKNKVIFNDADATITADKFYSTYTTTQALKESSFYNLEVTNATDNKLIFRDKIFCTDQAANAFVINDGVYTQHNTGANEFIYYEG